MKEWTDWVHKEIWPLGTLPDTILAESLTVAHKRIDIVCI